MAERLNAIGTGRIRVRVKDGTGTPNSYEAYLAAPPTFSPLRPRGKSVAVGQRSGSMALFAAINNGITGPGTLSFQYFLYDPANTSDATFHLWMENLAKGAYASPFGSYVDTNSLPLGGSEDICALFEVIFENSGQSGTDAMWSADGQVVSLSENGDKDGSIIVTATVNIVEDWTKGTAS